MPLALRVGGNVNWGRFMKSANQLTARERDFFNLVFQAGITNPFSDERAEIDLKIGGLFPEVSQPDRIEKTINEVQNRITSLEKKRLADLSLFTGDDRRLVRSVFLFEFFYKFRRKFDQLIQDQIKAGDAPVKVPFFTDAFTLMLSRGFSITDVQRYFALCYQLRRGFFFIKHSLVGKSNTMKQLRRNLWQNVFTHNLDLYNHYLWNRLEDFSTLVLGETGTGKGTAAMAIGRSGFIPFNERKKTFVESFTRSFISLNLSQYPETLIESELFGHKKGAFTGAVKDHRGVFSRCSPYGAILLDEIGEVSIRVQIKLLEVLQERTFSPVGSHATDRFQGRVIAATNRSLSDIRSKDVFRDDFFYRLSSDIITVPPLRQRIEEDPDELKDLVVFTVKKMVGKPYPELVELVLEVIEKQLGKDYPWPGNVRELEQCIRRVMLKRDYRGDHKPLNGDLAAILAEGISRGELDAQNLLSGYCKMLYRRHGTFEEVARRTHLDRRTVKKYINEWTNPEEDV